MHLPGPAVGAPRSGFGTTVTHVPQMCQRPVVLSHRRLVAALLTMLHVCMLPPTCAQKQPFLAAVVKMSFDICLTFRVTAVCGEGAETWESGRGRTASCTLWSCTQIFKPVTETRAQLM